MEPLATYILKQLGVSSAVIGHQPNALLCRRAAVSPNPKLKLAPEVAWFYDQLSWFLDQVADNLPAADPALARRGWRRGSDRRGGAGEAVETAAAEAPPTAPRRAAARARRCARPPHDRPLPARRYRRGFPYRAFDPERRIAWEEGRWLDDGTAVLVPSGLVRLDERGRLCQATSNGLAAGRSFDQAATPRSSSWWSATRSWPTGSRGGRAGRSPASPAWWCSTRRSPSRSSPASRSATAALGAAVAVGAACRPGPRSGGRPRPP